jgi:hypothetical protein
MTRGLMPSSSAASFCTQFDIFSASTTAWRSISSSGIPVGGIRTTVARSPLLAGDACSPICRSLTVTAEVSASSTARSITFSSSRMLPGQLCRMSSFWASGCTFSTRFLSSLAKRLTKNSASAGMSSLRSRSGGVSTVTTFSR